MPTIRFQPPLVADLSAFLAARGADVPEARIKIYSAFWVGRDKLVAGNCYYLLGENGWKDTTEFAGALRNYSEPPEGVQARDYWYYNQCNFAANAAVQAYLAAENISG
jgi:hypothetical protein